MLDQLHVVVRIRIVMNAVVAMFTFLTYGEIHLQHSLACKKPFFWI